MLPSDNKARLFVSSNEDALTYMSKHLFTNERIRNAFQGSSDKFGIIPCSFITFRDHVSDSFFFAKLGNRSLLVSSVD